MANKKTNIEPMESTESTAIAIQPEQSAAALDLFRTAAHQMENEAQGYNPEPIMLGIIHGAAIFDIPGQEAPVKELNGVILASRMERVFFPVNNADTRTILEITNRRPICASRDYMHGEINDNAKETDNEALAIIVDQIKACSAICANCPMNAWGSVAAFGVPGRGKVCKEKRRLLYWTLGTTMPMILTVPTSSIKAWDGYCSSLQLARKPHNIVNTAATLRIVEGAGQNYSVMSFTTQGDLTEAQAGELLQQCTIKGRPTFLFKGLVDLFAGIVIEEEAESTDDF